MSPDDFQRAIEARRITFENMLFAERRMSELADEFTKLEVQIAAILLAFQGVFLEKMFLPMSGSKESIFTGTIEVVLQSFYSASAILLVLSLCMGLVHIKRREMFWQKHHYERIQAVHKWREVVNGDFDFSRAKDFMTGMSAGKSYVSVTPPWTWIIQTLFLFLGVVCLLVLFFIVVFV